MIPLLMNHDHSCDPIGVVTAKDDRITVTLKEGHYLTKEQIFAVMGHAGVVITKQHFTETGALIEEFEVLEWSLVP